MKIEKNDCATASFKAMAAIVLMLASLSCGAAVIDPEPGMWGFELELDGKPGRGLQIDDQGGDLIIVTYFGYRSDGSSLFLQASGRKTGRGAFSGPLVEYRNGRTLGFGGYQRSAEAAGTAGAISIVFDSPTTGSVSLPGETDKRIRRLDFSDAGERLRKWTRFSGVASRDNSTDMKRQQYTFSVAEGSFQMVQSPAEGEAGATCTFEGTYSPDGKRLRSNGRYTCIDPPSAGGYSGYLTVTREGAYTGVFDIVFFNSGMREYHYGLCESPGPGTGSRCEIEALDP